MSAMSDAPACRVNVIESHFTTKYLLIQWIGVRIGRIILVVIIPYEIIPSSNLKPGTKTSAKCWVIIVDARINAGFGKEEKCEYMRSGATEK